jgi:peptidoglycan/LPS O-acetylase OafA/YrhL
VKKGLFDDLMIVVLYLALLVSCVVAHDWLTLALTVLLMTMPAFLRALRLWERWLDRPRRRTNRVSFCKPVRSGRR